VQLHHGSDAFKGLGGLFGLKNFCHRLLTTRRSTSEGPTGVLLLGVSGTGNWAFAKSLGNETGRPTLSLDLGALMGSLVGQTEQNIRRPLKTIDAMSPCIAFVDEIEKGLAGAQGSQGDSGVSARLFGSLLSWLNDHTSDVFFVATSTTSPNCRRSLRGLSASMRSSSSTFPAGDRRTTSGRCTVPCSASTLPNDPTTINGRRPRSRRAAGWRRSWASRSRTPRNTSSPWRQRLLSKSPGSGSGRRGGVSTRKPVKSSGVNHRSIVRCGAILP
jgi:hypothetical protein